MKVCMFHLMPYRGLPADFDQRYKSAYIDPLWFDVADADKVGEYYNATLDEIVVRREIRLSRLVHQPASSERLWLHGQSEHHGGGAGQRHQRPERRHRAARLDAAVDHAADPHRRGIRDARLHQRRALGRRLSHRLAVRRHDLQRRRPDRAARALSRGVGARRSKPGRRARSSPGTASIISSAWSISGRGRSSSRIRRSGFPAPAFPRTAEYVVERGPLLLSSQLLRRQERQAGDRSLLGSGGAQGPRR